MLAGVYGICSLAASWIIAPLMYWNMTDGHNFRTQENCLEILGDDEKWGHIPSKRTSLRLYDPST